MMVVDLPCHQTKVAITGLVLPPIHPIHPIPQYGFPQVWTNLMLQGRRTDNTMGFSMTPPQSKPVLLYAVKVNLIFSLTHLLLFSVT